MIFGHLGYPILQAADILLYKAHLVPVGEDQLPHVEVTREVARKFNKTYGDVLRVPQGKVTDFARLPGLDGNKMSKSLGNTILLSDPPEEINKKVMRAVTDPQKIRRGDPGRPEVCNIFTYYKKFCPQRVKEVEAGCKSGKLGCVEDKRNFAACLANYLEPFREKRVELEKNMDHIKDIIAQGNKVASEVAGQTMSEVYTAMNLD